jgi:hypothetical protein
MPNADDIRWFKEQFHQDIEAALGGTPFDLDMIVAIACQETGHIWSTLRKKPQFTRADILALCVGDTLDADRGRKAFPKTKAELIAKPNGQAMFDIAHKALVDMAAHIPGFKAAAAKPNKFCHGFGLFQYDLQFFLVDPDYFLQKRYEQFGQTLAKCLGELRNGLKKLGFQSRTSLTDTEFAHVAIAYNTGGFKPAKGLKQGHENNGRFYGEEVFDFVRLSRTVAKPGGVPAIPPPVPGNAIVPPPTPVAATGGTFVVDTLQDPLRLRSEPKVSAPSAKNVIAHLPDGHPVRAVTGKKVNGFVEVETSLAGAHLRGFAAADFLKPAPAATPVPVAIPAASPPADGIVAVIMPRKTGTVAKRSENAGAHSLNETGQPGRTATTPEALVGDIKKIIDWLAVDKVSHKRYRPRDGLTFCNIYAHDYCHLAGAYLPRVWWKEGAIRDLAQGKTVQPLIGNTIREMLANDLFHWLREFGLGFGWRQTGTLSKLQEAANQGAIGLIVARRKQDGKPGHIVMVVPETGGNVARRDAAGETIAPVQSQAGATNFRFGTGKLDWWKGDQFAETAFWIHS